MITLVQTSFPDRATAERIGRLVVEARLAACCNIMDECRSIYRWRGEVEEADEVIALFKTAPVRARRLVERLTMLHPYELAAIEQWEAAVAPAIEEWVTLETD